MLYDCFGVLFFYASFDAVSIYFVGTSQTIPMPSDSNGSPEPRFNKFHLVNSDRF